MPDLTKSFAPVDEQVTLPPSSEPALVEATLPSSTERTPLQSPLGVDLVGRRFGKFEIVAELGRGGMGVVFKANQLDLNRTVAIKVILHGAAAGPDNLRRFRTEAEATAALHHPNVVRIYEVGEIDGCPFFSMEFIAGQTLAQRLASGPLPSKVAACHTATIARAIQHAHDHNILHRDLKPSNVLLDGEDHAHVMDFGLAKRLETDSGQTRTGPILGTPSYMAPEQAAGNKQLTPAVDVYGLGALFYELLTARPPFRAETTLDTVLQVLERDPAPPILLNPKVDRDLQTICLKCLEKDPARRYASAVALAEDLERYLAGVSINARSVNLVNRLSSLLEHSQYDSQFENYSNILFGFAVIMALAEGAKFWAFHSGQGLLVLSMIEAARFGSTGSLLLWLRPSGFRPTSASERLLWSVWIGYFLTLFSVAIAHWSVMGGWAVEQEFQLYPPIAAVTGLAFFVLGSSYWGWCYALGLAFHLLALLMVLDLRWAPLEYGILWGISLTSIGMRLRRLAANARTARVHEGEQ